jgi:hypothetical protein
MSERDPALPADWPARPDVWWYAGVTMVLAGGVIVSGVGLTYALSGGLGVALVFALVGLLNLALVADSLVIAEFGVRSRGGGIQLDYVDELTQWATVFPYRWSVEITVRVFWLLAFASFGPLALSAVRAESVLVFAGAFLVFGLAGVVLIRSTFRGAFWRGRSWRGKLALTSEGVYHRWWLYSVFLPWQHISGVRAGVAVPYAPKFRRGRAKPGPLIELEVASVSEKEAASHVLNGRWLWWPLAPGSGRPARRRHRRLTVSALAADSVLVYRSLRFYHRHPELRWELGTHVAAERFLNADLQDSADD